MRLLIVLSLALLLGGTGQAVASSTLATHNTPYGFSVRDVLRYQARLNYFLRPNLPGKPRFVCRGENPVTLRGGRRGYHHIRCYTGLYIPDFLYHIGRTGKVFLTRPYVR